MSILLPFLLQQHIKSLSGDSMLGVLFAQSPLHLYEIDFPTQNTHNTLYPATNHILNVIFYTTSTE